MSAKTKQVPGNKQQKLLACVGSYLTLLYNIHCPTGVTRSAQWHLQGAGGTSQPTSHTSTHRCSQTHSHRDGVSAGSPCDNCKCSKCQHTEERAGGQWWEHVPPQLHGNLSQQCPWLCRVCQGLHCFRNVRRLNRTSEKMQRLSGYFWPKPIYKQYSYL